MSTKLALASAAFHATYQLELTHDSYGFSVTFVGFRAALEKDFRPPPSPAAARRERGAVAALELSDSRVDHITGLFAERSRAEAAMILKGSSGSDVKDGGKQNTGKPAAEKGKRKAKMVVLRGGKLVLVKRG